MCVPSRSAVLLVTTCTYLTRETEGILPTGTVEVLTGDNTRHIHHVSIAAFSPSLPFGKSSSSVKSNLALPPQDDSLLCNEADGLVEYTPSTITTEEDYYVGASLLVPRGGCTFQAKALAAQHLGASSILIYNTLASRYSLNETSQNSPGDNNNPMEQIIWPRDRNDYECSHSDYANSTGGWIPKASLSFDPLPYNSQNNDIHLSGDKSTCASTMPSWSSCQSSKCLLTGEENNEKGLMRACCAWDIHLSMGYDFNLTSYQINIPTLFLTMRQADDLLSVEQLFQYNTVELYERWYPKVNASSFLLWILGTFVTWLACFVSGHDYRNIKKIIGREVKCGRGMVVFGVSIRINAPSRTTATATGERATARRETTTGENNADENSSAARARNEQQRQEGNHSTAITIAEENQEATVATASTATEFQDESSQTSMTLRTVPVSNHVNTQQQQEQQQQQRPIHQNESSSFEITIYHAIFFLIFASATLFILFFFKIYSLVRILYGLGCSGATSQVIFSPLYNFLIQHTCCRSCLSPLQKNICPKIRFCDINHIRYVDALSFLSGYGLGITWLCVGFISDDPSSNPFYWITQDILGASICILFLSLLRLNSIKVGSVLLVAAFVYDIFFVFITPYIFKGESIMISVATSGGPPKGDADFCEKYPNEDECQGGDPLPMLFALPKVGDYRGGSVLLGLGDVVLPGLLISFAARLDCARLLLDYCARKAVEVSEGMRRQQNYHQQQHNGRERAVLANDDHSNNSNDDDDNFVEHCRRPALTKIRQQIYHSFAKGYFYPLIVSYALGLLFAYIGVYVMKKGQPALLYLVPMNLGTMICLGQIRGELKELWNGSEDIMKANRVVRRVPQRLDAAETATAEAAELTVALGVGEDHHGMELSQYAGQRREGINTEEEEESLRSLA